jgi:metal-responsive CopG/Arc/MetJ family transcriptional regulator
METIQLSIDESLLAEVQQATNALEMTPSDFMKVALERALQQREIIARERRDAQGYAEHPQRAEEIEEWHSEQDWGEP